jgi:hypothetical protein
MIFIACGTQHSVVSTAPVAPIASTAAEAIIRSLFRAILVSGTWSPRPAATGLRLESVECYSCLGVTVMTMAGLSSALRKMPCHRIVTLES